MPRPTHVKLKRVYARPAASDGTRILVDRIWPRGVRKADAALDAWLKDLAPSTGLRKWFGHDPERWPLFRQRYEAELAGHTAELQRLRALCRRGVVTLVFAARDEAHTHAIVLRDVVQKKPPSTTAKRRSKPSP